MRLPANSSDAITHQSRAPPPPPPEPGVGFGVEAGGAAEPVTVTVIEADADRFAPSTAATVTVTVPPGPFAGITESVHDSVETPQSAGAIVTPGVPAVTIEAGIEDVLLLVTEKCSAPVPLTVNGYDGELEPAMSAEFGSEVMVGKGIFPSAPMASMRPNPNVPSGEALPS
jgi:hypothetical protein